MTSINAVRLIVQYTSIASAIIAASAFYSAYGAEDITLQEVIVTGSRIPQPNMTSTSPIQVVTEQEIKQQGATDIVDLINILPQEFQNNATDFSNTTNPLTSPGGLTTANLRGLGPQRTLVLVNGKRLGVGDANTGNPNPAPDLDQIPTPLVERVEVLTGGASAVYGSDAVAGVINFILKRNFEGVQADLHYGFNDHDNDNTTMQNLQLSSNMQPPPSHVRDGYNKAFSLVMGSNSENGKGNVTGYFVYREADPITEGQRDYSACKLNVTVPAGVMSCSGTPNSNQFIENFAPNATFAVVGSNFVPWNQNAATNPPPLFNANPYQYLSRQDTRYLAGFDAHYELSDMFKPYVDFSFMNDRSSVLVAPTGLFQSLNPYVPGGGYLINCGNPLLSAQQQATICTPTQISNDTSVNLNIGRRNVEGGGRLSEFEHENFRGVFGLKGSLGDVWEYDVYGQYYYTTFQQSALNYMSFTAINRALQVVNVAGVPTCKSVVDRSDLKCVPYNIFTEGAVTNAQLDYLNSLGTAYGTVTQKTIATNATADLGKYGLTIPTATSGIGVAVGSEYRKEALAYLPDKGSQSGDLAGFSGASPAIKGDYSVQEEYLEFRAPLVQERPFAQDLVFEGGLRHSQYTNSGGVNTHKLALQYAPTTDVRFRTSFQRAIRAPNIIELYNPMSVTNTSTISSDPCAGATPTASLTNCMRTGVTALQYGTIGQCPAGQCSVLRGGNPGVLPETSNTMSFGFTLTPRFLPDFTASIDYYKIEVQEQIGTVSISILFNNCLNLGLDCENVVRSSTGALVSASIADGGYVKGNLINIGASEVTGVDVQMGYRHAVGNLGSISLAMAGAYLKSSTTTRFAGGPSFDCAGLFGSICKTVNPTWRHNLRLNWETPINLLVSTQWRYISSVSLDTNTSDPQLTNGRFDAFNADLPSVTYIDLSFIYDIDRKIAIRAGINNLLDKDPPLVNSLISGTGTPNAYPTYDLLGRTVFIGLQLKL